MTRKHWFAPQSGLEDTDELADPALNPPTRISIDDVTQYVQYTKALHDEMLAAVKAATVRRDPRHRVSMLVNDWQRILDAIAKAEGREHQPEGPPCGCQQKRHNCDQFNGLPVTVRES